MVEFYNPKAEILSNSADQLNSDNPYQDDSLPPSSNSLIQRDLGCFRRGVIRLLKDLDEDVPKYLQLEKEQKLACTAICAEQLKECHRDGLILFSEPVIYTYALTRLNLSTLSTTFGYDQSPTAEVHSNWYPITTFAEGENVYIQNGNHRMFKALFMNPENLPVFFLHFASRRLFEDFTNETARSVNTKGELGIHMPQLKGTF